MYHLPGLVLVPVRPLRSSLGYHGRCTYSPVLVSLSITPQLVPVHLIRLDGSPALTGHYMMNMITTHDYHDPSEHFVGSGRQTIPLTGYRDLVFFSDRVRPQFVLVKLPLSCDHNWIRSGPVNNVR